jgi:hypothetical protein
MKLQVAGTLNGYTIENLKDERPTSNAQRRTSNNDDATLYLLSFKPITLETNMISFYKPGVFQAR